MNFIETKVNKNKLETRLHAFQSTPEYNLSSRLMMSHKTFNMLTDDNHRACYQNKDEGFYDVYMGIKIVFDDTLPLGEVSVMNQVF